MEEHLERKYHGDPIRAESALVSTDFAADDVLAEFVERAGFIGEIHTVSEKGRGVRDSRVVVAQRPR
jgi:hypothetical protein